MRRRELLALAAGGLAAAAGCLDESRGPTESDDPGGADGTGSEQRTDRSTVTDETTPTPTATDAPETPETSVTPEPKDVREVTVDALQPGLIELGTPDSITVTGETRWQYLFLEVTGGEDPPARSSFVFELDGTGYPPIEETRGIWRAYNEDESEQYQPSSPGWLLFELPASAADPETTRLRWPGGSWQPGETVRERLGTLPPSFDVSVDVPETVPVGEKPRMTVTAENTGDVPSRFLLAVAYAPESAVRKLVEPGESEEWTGEPSFFRSDEVSAGDTTTLKFDWLGGSTEREVEFIADTERSG